MPLKTASTNDSMETLVASPSVGALLLAISLLLLRDELGEAREVGVGGISRPRASASATSKRLIEPPISDVRCLRMRGQLPLARQHRRAVVVEGIGLLRVLRGEGAERGDRRRVRERRDRRGVVVISGRSHSPGHLERRGPIRRGVSLAEA